ncbi:hypothetical protein [Burkholderia cepacia]|uniref:hypothetical protein n=1 Tax=Burkholderia cepacia TaxID=292 RepID=UPI0012D9011C|nr:hypothetical protein [Burkholderia cepacia]
MKTDEIFMTASAVAAVVRNGLPSIAVRFPACFVAPFVPDEESLDPSPLAPLDCRRSRLTPEIRLPA